MLDLLTFLHQSRVILGAIGLSMLLSIIGLIGVLRMNLCLQFTHSFFCSSILGAFYFYLMIDTYLKSGSQNQTFSDSTILFFLTLPFLFIFIIGCHSLYLTNLIFDEKKRLKSGNQPLLSQNRNQRYDYDDGMVDLLVIPEEMLGQALCVICMAQTKDSIFYPCGHECVCFECGKSFMRQVRDKICPICRNQIKDVVRVYR